MNGVARNLHMKKLFSAWSTSNWNRLARTYWIRCVLFSQQIYCSHARANNNTVCTLFISCKIQRKFEILFFILTILMIWVGGLELMFEYVWLPPSSAYLEIESYTSVLAHKRLFFFKQVFCHRQYFFSTTEQKQQFSFFLNSCLKTGAEFIQQKWFTMEWNCNTLKTTTQSNFARFSVLFSAFELKKSEMEN